MSLLVPNEGEIKLLDKMIKDALSVNEDYSLRLYKNDYTPVEASTLTDFTVADFTTYTNRTLLRASWGGAADIGGGTIEMSYAEQTWTNTGAVQTIYGYYVVGADSGKVLWAERFAASRALNTGDTLNLTLKFQLA